MAKKILGAGSGEHLPAGEGLRKGVKAADALQRERVAGEDRRMERVAGEDLQRERLTGRLLVRIDPGAGLSGVLKGLKGFVLQRLRVAVIEEGSAAEARKMAAEKGSAFVMVEPERVLRKSGAGDTQGGLPFVDNRVASWGIQAMNVLGSEYTGKGVKLAVLDTGFDFGHPDFAGRTIHRKSFVGRQAIDKDGHGTHCTGIAAGNRAVAKVGAGKEGARAKAKGLNEPDRVEAGAAKFESAPAKVGKGKAGVRYGVAPGVRLYIGKILDDNGEGTDGEALAGIEWALEKGCKVISMSFGAEAEEGYSAVFENVAQTVLAQGALLIGATGNESKRGRMAAVNHPANCPSVMAVGALTAGLKVAEYSCRGKGFERAIGEGGARGRAAAGASGGLSDGGAVGQVDVVAPGDQILSAKLGGGTELDSGTSMAAPFVAGVAALLWEEFPGASGWEIWAKLVQRAKRLGLPAAAVGAGLVYAG